MSSTVVALNPRSSNRRSAARKSRSRVSAARRSRRPRCLLTGEGGDAGRARVLGFFMTISHIRLGGVNDSKSYMVESQLMFPGALGECPILPGAPLLCPYCKDLGSDRFLGLFWFNSAINSFAGAGAAVLPSRIISCALILRP